MDLGNRPTQEVRGFPALVAPAAVAASAVIAAGVLHVRDPNVIGSYGICPMYAFTGLWCPACGGLRAIHALTDLDVADALDSNVLVVPLVIAAVIAWVRWLALRWKGSRERVLSTGRPATVVVAVSLLAFTVTRNTPWGSWLAPA